MCKTNLSKMQNVFVQIAKCICPNCKLYSSKLQTVFVQIAKCICWCFECNRVPVVEERSGQWLRAAIPSHQHLALKLYGFGHNMLPASIGSKSFSHKMIILEIQLLKYAIPPPFHCVCHEKSEALLLLRYFSNMIIINGRGTI